MKYIGIIAVWLLVICMFAIGSGMLGGTGGSFSNGWTYFGICLIWPSSALILIAIAGLSGIFDEDAH